MGITATDPTQADAGTLGIAAAAWLGISLLIALFRRRARGGGGTPP